jgi:hypothetical protein
MRNVKPVVISTALACLVAVVPLRLPAQTAGRTSPEQVRKEVGEAVAAITAYSADRRDEALAKAGSEIERLDRYIERLDDRVDARWDQLDQATRARVRTTLKMLRKQRTDLAEWAGRLRESSAGAWEHVKAGFVTSYRALADAFAKAEDEFK